MVARVGSNIRMAYLAREIKQVTQDKGWNQCLQICFQAQPKEKKGYCPISHSFLAIPPLLQILKTNVPTTATDHPSSWELSPIKPSMTAGSSSSLSYPTQRCSARPRTISSQPLLLLFSLAPSLGLSWHLSQPRHYSTCLLSSILFFPSEYTLHESKPHFVLFSMAAPTPYIIPGT